MKKFSKIITTMFMLAVIVISGAMLVGCGEKDFDKSKISIGQTSFTYDGNSHIYEVTYEDEKDVIVKYSLDGENFVDKENINLKNVGIYTLYFKLSLEGYNDYTGNEKVGIKGFEAITQSTVSSFANFADAMANVQNNGTIKMFDNVELTQPLAISKSITLNGQGKYNIKASDSFAGGNILEIETADITVTLKDVNINANQKARIAYVEAGKLVVDGAVLENGYRADTYAYGVYITKSASFEMISGSIKGHQKEADTEYTKKYCADLWIGANANGVINGGEIENMFINANSYSQTNPGKVTVNGGKIYNAYVEYGNGYGAKLEFKGGEIMTLRISTTESNGNFVVVSPIINTTYVGGVTE